MKKDCSIKYTEMMKYWGLKMIKDNIYSFEIIIKDMRKEKIIKHEIHEDIRTIDIDYDTEIKDEGATVKKIRIFVER